jgi:tRNA1Val (adenine37-N6)-methyltransferase
VPRTPAPDPSGQADALELTLDSLLGGQVQFQQPRGGYRVNVDSVLLAAFAARGRRAARAIDLGAGVGLVALLLAHLGAARELWLVEREATLARVARTNLEAASVPGRVWTADVKSLKQLAELRQSAELVACNPPFFGSGRHRTPKVAERARARVGEVAPFVCAAAHCLSGNKGRAIFAYPASELGELLEAATRARLVAKRLRLVHAFADKPARLALLEFKLARPGGLVVEAPLIEWERPGQPTAELLALNSGRASERK